MAGRLWPRGWADTWSSSRRSREQPADPRAGRMLGRGRAAPGRRAASPWVALWLPMCPTWTQSAPRAVLQIRTRLRILGTPGRAGGRAPGPSSGLSSGRPDGLPAGRAEGSGAGCMARGGCLQGGAVHLPGRPWPGGWAGTWSRLQAVRRTARRADSGPPEGHGPDAGQKPGGSSAARCVALGGSGNN